MANINLCNEMQKCALNAAKAGHNVLITGQCGTGKTFLLRQIILTMRAKKQVAVIASTGMAATQLCLDATTLHHWSGLGDGRLSKDELYARFLTDDKFAEARKRIAAADVLAIDEIGMVSEVIFEKLEAVCRLVKGNNTVFGGLQMIGCGDFKQLPPVPKYRYSDPGYHCFKSEIFNDVFPHHFDLVEVVRQNEPDLVLAIHQLCEGCPDKNTETLLKSLNRDLTDDKGVCRLFGTNFDAAYINQYYLDAHAGELYTYKASDEGKTRLLINSGAEKHLSLKVGAPVILTRNLHGNLYNGLTGIVHSLNAETGPVINFGGKLVSIPKMKFEEYDPSTNTVLATRVQYPLKLAFALTVHRAQGQEFDRLEIDCYSFFAPGQMGVAVGRAVKKSGLKILHYNSRAANLKHPQEVYDFYFRQSVEPKDDLACCSHDYTGNDSEESDIMSDLEPTKPTEADPVPGPSSAADILCPWPVDEFISSESGKTFMPTQITDSFKRVLADHAGVLYSNVIKLFKKKSKSTDDFTRLYKEANKYVTSDEHVFLASSLSLSPKPQKLSTKLYFWIIDKKINILAEKVIQPQEKKMEHLPDKKNITDAAKSKIRYVAGVCLHKIIARLHANVFRNIGKGGEKHRVQREWDYRCFRLLNTLRITEEDAKKMTIEPESMLEIDYKQGPSRGLLHVPDSVFNFFLSVNSLLQKLLSPEAFHLYGDRIHSVAQHKLFANETLLEIWLNLFSAECASEPEDSDEDELYIMMLSELFEFVVEHFLRVSLVEGLYYFKTELPRKKKQAIRTKITALSERESVPRKKTRCDTEEEEVYNCPTCNKTLIDNPEEPEDDSIACDLCNQWFHFKCQGLTGLEPFLKKSSSKWKCNTCKGSGRGRGRGSGRGRGRGRGKGRGKKSK